MAIEECPWCKARLEAIDGPTHQYMESSPSCWAVYGRVLAREYEDQRFFAVHRLTVDAYAVQHPGKPSRQAIQSVGVHLVRLYLLVEKKLDPARANDAMLAAAKQKAVYQWLEPPPSLGKLTAADIAAAADVDEHKRLVGAWAKQMWEVWLPHHATVKRWAFGV